ncbi:MAG: UDP-N-acetylmuramoyl-tripeptide--D-alanyl-D-alanine ligase [Flavobacteriales bacterium]|nr:UDP-N-acetylmuramoyl-tripeptide--D-alanyl-D-alanine ligase [Flavobacteriales bacterium]
MDLLSLFRQSGSICTDTRNVQPGALFFALKGERFNGNEFATQALADGCSYAIIDEAEYARGEQYIVVKNVLEALQHLANAYRKSLKIPVLAITGSNGKTTTKELVREVLKRKFQVHATHGNLNNHIGVPLTLLSLPASTDFAIIEMGANHQREIAHLCEIAEPGFGLITNIGRAHLEGFGGIEGVRKGKGELFDFLRTTGGTAFVNTGAPPLEEMSAGMDRILYGSDGPGFKLRAVDVDPTLTLELTYGNQQVEFQTHLTGTYNLHNFATAIAVGLHFEVPLPDICEAMALYVPDNQRSQVKSTDSNTLILDAYNANPSSMAVALENLASVGGSKAMFIIGDMFELGDEAPVEHQRIADLADELGLEGVLIGSAFGACHTRFTKLESTEKAKEYFAKNKPADQTILIKGSRGMRLEGLVELL